MADTYVRCPACDSSDIEELHKDLELFRCLDCDEHWDEGADGGGDNRERTGRNRTRPTDEF